MCLERVTGRNLKETEENWNIRKNPEGNWRKRQKTEDAVFCCRIFAPGMEKMQSNSAKVGKNPQSRHKNGKYRFLLPYLCSGKWAMQKRTKSEQLFLEIALFPPYICNAKPKCRCRNANRTSACGLLIHPLWGRCFLRSDVTYRRETGEKAQWSLTRLTTPYVAERHRYR